MILHGNAKDLSGKRFGMLIAIRPIGSKNGLIWECKCDCGNTHNVKARDLLCGDTKSCGCQRNPKGIKRNYKHGLGYKRVYRIYHLMISRCHGFTHNNKNYKDRGIKVCDEWRGDQGLIRFVKWAYAHGYADELTLDRIDVNGNYEPSNCRWVTMKDQSNNKTTSHYIVYNGEKKTVSQWAEQLGIKRTTIKNRLMRGWDEYSALSTPVGVRRL